MKDFQGSVAVVTGAAGGIGLALARAAQARGAALVIADVNVQALGAAEAMLAPHGDVIAVETDVANPAAVDALAKTAVKRFGKVNLLFNVAGVYVSGRTWAISREQYDWVIGVNLKSVINGLTAFVPRMIAQGDPCQVVVVSSGAGLISTVGGALYSTTKHAVVALTEALRLDLAAENIANVGVTLVMPGAVQSRIMHPEDTAPDSLRAELAARLEDPRLAAAEAAIRTGVGSGLPPANLAEQVFDAIASGELYVRPAFTDQLHALARTIAMRRLGE